MGQVKMDGSLLLGPNAVSDSAFPGGVKQVPLCTYPNPKPSIVDSGLAKRNVNSPGSFVPLSGVGPADDVTKGDFLYLKCTSPMILRMTVTDGVTDTNYDVPILGGMHWEFPVESWLKGLSIKGSGEVEYAISGVE